MMNIFLNNKIFVLTKSITIETLLQLYPISEKLFVIAVNNQIITKADYPYILLLENDYVDIIIPMQGG